MKCIEASVFAHEDEMNETQNKIKECMISKLQKKLSEYLNSVH